MARFPSKEAEVLALSQEMASGLAANVAIYPSPNPLKLLPQRYLLRAKLPRLDSNQRPTD